MGIHFNQMVNGILVGLSSAIFGQLIYIYVLSKGELSITATLLASFPIYTIMLSILFNHEHLTPLEIGFIGLSILGTIIVSLPEKINGKDLKKSSYIALAVVTAVIIGSSDVASKWLINRSSVGTFLFFTSFAQLITSFVYLKIEKEKLSQFKSILTKLNDYKFAILGSLALVIGTMFLFLAFNFTLASIASPIVGTYPVLTIVLALIFLKEKLSFKNLIGVICVVISVLGVGLLGK